MAKLLQETRQSLQPRDDHASKKVTSTIEPRSAQIVRRPWKKDELLVVLNLYHKLTFGQFHSTTPAIVALAEKFGRTPDSVSMKLSNFASFDPALRLRGVKGLQGASALDRSVWDEFHADLSETVPASEEAFRALFQAGDECELEVNPKEGVRVRTRPPEGPTETIANVKVRRGQEYFRQIVLNNFDNRCGVCGLAVRELLIASHILPWRKHESERLNVRNGLCLSRLHDAAFDNWLIAFDDNFRLLLSPNLKRALPRSIIDVNFCAFEGESLKFPAEAIPPDAGFLSVHRAKWKSLSR